MIHRDNVYMLVQRGTGGIWYSPPATNPTDCWKNAMDWYVAQDCDICEKWWKRLMKRKGWSAKRVSIFTEN